MSAETLRVFPMTPRRHYIRRLNEGHAHVRNALTCFHRKESGWEAQVEVNAELARRTIKEARLLGLGMTDEQLGYVGLTPIPPYRNPVLTQKDAA